MTVNERIDALIQKRGMSRRQLALTAGLPPSSFQAAMARDTSMTIGMVQCVANALGVSVSYLLGESPAVFSPHVQEKFISRVLEVVGLNENPYEKITDTEKVLTVDAAKKIADELGVTMDYLVGRTDEPHTQSMAIHNSDIRYDIDFADYLLIESVHEICGMDKNDIASCYATGTIADVWDSRKIDLIREYIEDSKIILQKLLNAKFPPKDYDVLNLAASGKSTTQSNYLDEHMIAVQKGSGLLQDGEDNGQHKED